MEADFPSDQGSPLSVKIVPYLFLDTLWTPAERNGNKSEGLGFSEYLKP